MAYVIYESHDPQSPETILVRSLSEVPGLFEAWIQSLSEGSFMPFLLACPFGPDKRAVTQPFVNHFDPDYVVRTFVLKACWKPSMLPELLKDEFNEEDFPDKVDTSDTELLLLKKMGYTRWNEVKYCMQGQKFEEGSLTTTKRHMLEHELGLI